MTESSANSDIPDDPTKLAIFDQNTAANEIGLILESLKRDQVVLVQGVQPSQADSLMYNIAISRGLKDALEMQATFADYLGHRQRVGRYFMTVNRRSDYQFISSHSEGSTAAGMQLAALYCYENSTDGGENILMNVNSESTVWSSLREKVTKGRLESGPLSRQEIARARGQYHLNLQTDLVKEDDTILQERKSDIPGLTLVDVLTRPERSHCRILERDLNVYWDSIDGPDLDAAREFERLLRKWGLLKEPLGGLELAQMDEGASHRVWQSGLDYGQLFKCKIIRKLAPGEFVVQNNLTWTHATNNWSPGSGTRNIVASFA